MATSPIDLNREIYADFHKDLLVSPVNSDLARKTNEEAVKESIKNLIFTDRGERPFQPQLGSNIRKMLFDMLTPSTIILAKELIKETIENFEPRANLIDVEVTGAIDSNALKATIIFAVANVEDPIVLETILTRVR